MARGGGGARGGFVGAPRRPTGGVRGGRLSGQKVWYHAPGRNRIKWLSLRERLALQILYNRETGDVQAEAQVDGETKAQLEALGYILDGQDGVAAPARVTAP